MVNGRSSTNATLTDRSGALQGRIGRSPPARQKPPAATWPAQTPAPAGRAAHREGLPASGNPLRWPRRPPADLVFSQSLIIQVAVLPLTATPAPKTTQPLDPNPDLNSHPN